MKLELLDLARGDLIEGYHFKERQEAGLGTYYPAPPLYSGIDSLRIFGGIHRKAHKTAIAPCPSAFHSPSTTP